MSDIIPDNFKTDHEKDFFIKAKIEEFKATVSFAQIALKAAMLINGGAAVAILAFMGNTWRKGNATTSPTESLWFFTGGIITAAFAAGVAYLAQHGFVLAKNENEHKSAMRWRVTSIVLIILSYIIFAFGAWEASSTFSDSRKSQSTSCTCEEAAAGGPSI